MKRLNRKRLLAAAYLLALILWLAKGGGALVQKQLYTQRGMAPQVTLQAQDLEFTSIVPYQIDYEPVEGFWVSSDSDPHIFWNQEAWVDTVVLDIHQNKPAGGVELYYKEPGQADFSARQVIYPQKDAEGRYTFELGGRLVSGLRIDPDSVGGVLMEFRSLQINPNHAWVSHFIPSAGQLLILLLAPLGLAALVAELTDLAQGAGKKHESESQGE